MPGNPRTRFDGPWKAALERWLPEFLALFVLHVYRDIDWSLGFTFLDTELAQITPDAASGGGIVDKLARVTLVGGGEAYVLIHIEVQNQRDQGFERRMFRYHARLLDHVDVPVYSLAVLGDPHPLWRPACYERAQWDCHVKLAFPVIKLLDWREQTAALEASRNPFATIALAHLGAIATKDSPENRYITKWQLVRRLYGLGYSKAEIDESYRLLDWLLRLPKTAEQQFHREVIAFEEEQHMTYVSSAERFGRAEGRKEGRQEGRQEGRAEGYALAIRLRFGGEGEALAAQVEVLADPRRLDRLAALLLSGAGMDALAGCLA
jgi:hypothetical protein